VCDVRLHNQKHVKDQHVRADQTHSCGDWGHPGVEILTWHDRGFVVSCITLPRQIQDKTKEKQQQQK